MTAPRVLYLTTQPDPSFWWRVARPVARLAEAGYPCSWARLDDVTLPLLGASADVVVFSRLYWTDHDYGAQLVHGLKAQGLTVLYEVDDDWYSDGVSERLVAALPRVGTVAMQEQARADRIFALRLMDGVIASSDGLAEVCRSVTDAPVVVVPNAIDAAWWADQLRDHERLIPGLTIGWLGGPRLEEDLAPVAVAWGRLAARYPDVQFVVTGDHPGGVARFVPPDRVWPIPWQPIEALPRAWASIDIACCAVADNRWNRAKTPIKAWEAALSGAAVVGTDALYGEIIRDFALGRFGLVANTADEWESTLDWFIRTPPDRTWCRDRLRTRVLRDHSLATQMQRWPAAWAALVEQSRLVAV